MAIINGKIHYKWSFSIAMLNYQRVCASHVVDFFMIWGLVGHIGIEWMVEMNEQE